MNESISLIAWSRFRLSPFDWDDGRTGWMDQRLNGILIGTDAPI